MLPTPTITLPATIAPTDTPRPIPTTEPSLTNLPTVEPSSPTVDVPTPPIELPPTPQPPTPAPPTAVPPPPAPLVSQRSPAPPSGAAPPTPRAPRAAGWDCGLRYSVVVDPDAAVPVYDQPDETAAPVRVLGGGRITVDCTKTAAGWTYVRLDVDGTQGWITEASNMLFIPEEPNVAAGECGLALVSGVAALTIRAAPDRASPALGVVAEGERVVLVCDHPIDADGRTWHRVRSTGVDGWMSKRFLDVIGYWWLP